jgi:predicted nucleic acid-binding Zn ribbon protein
MRRLAPRPLRTVLDGVVGEARPAGLLAAVQSAWPEVAGAALAAAATPVSERDRTVTIACESGVWAQELELLGPDLTARLNERLRAVAEPAAVERLKFVVRSGVNSP